MGSETRYPGIGLTMALAFSFIAWGFVCYLIGG